MLSHRSGVVKLNKPDLLGQFAINEVRLENGEVIIHNSREEYSECDR